MSERHTGKIKKFEYGSGYGHIIPDDPGPTVGADVFLHHVDFRIKLRPGIAVEYDLVSNDGKGLKAVNVVFPDQPLVAAARRVAGVSKKADGRGQSAIVRVAIAELEQALRGGNGA